MAIIASDFHGNLKKLDKFFNYKPEEPHYFLGDAVDSFKETPQDQEECLKRLLASGCYLIFGNHELSYHTKHKMPCSGRHYYGIENFPKYVERNRWKIAYHVDGYLLTHAGVSTAHVHSCKTLQGIVKRLNNYPKDLFDVGQCRGGWKRSGGPLWYDYRYDYDALSPRFNQVFGHCSLQQPWRATINNYDHICINSSDSSDDCWVFDTKTKLITIL